jgi:hypothetical protein
MSAGALAGHQGHRFRADGLRAVLRAAVCRLRCRRDQGRTARGGLPRARPGRFRAMCRIPEKSGLYFINNTNKRGISCDVSTEAGRARVPASRGVGGSADREQRAGADARSGASITPRWPPSNPDLVVVSITPFGQTGPYSDWNGHDLNAYHLTGASSRYCGRPGETPLEHGTFAADYYGAVAAAAWGLAAVHGRRQAGGGQHLDVSTAEAIAAAFVGGQNIGRLRAGPRLRQAHGRGHAAGRTGDDHALQGRARLDAGAGAGAVERVAQGHGRSGMGRSRTVPGHVPARPERRPDLFVHRGMDDAARQDGNHGEVPGGGLPGDGRAHGGRGRGRSRTSPRATSSSTSPIPCWEPCARWGRPSSCRPRPVARARRRRCSGSTPGRCCARSPHRTAQQSARRRATAGKAGRAAARGTSDGQRIAPEGHPGDQFRLGLGGPGGRADAGLSRRRGAQDRVARAHRHDAQPAALRRRRAGSRPQPVQPRLLGRQRLGIAEPEAAAGEATGARADREIGRGDRELRSRRDGAARASATRNCARSSTTW